MTQSFNSFRMNTYTNINHILSRENATNHTQFEMNFTPNLLPLLNVHFLHE